MTTPTGGRFTRGATPAPGTGRGPAHGHAERILGLPAVGTVAHGHAADLLVLDADPPRDIRNTRRTHGVVVDARWIPPEERRRLLTAVQRAAAQTPPPQEAAATTDYGCGGHP
ncbi:hypothetical protein [Streptomyces prunicolor]|uniref:Amidohydrolase-related domain-containing protein n=1 Tax=Streptomyces prunicolor TaxID=67348 RepID=A0ABU4FGR5_9ACTN|nr:hypothetical protein [Streptomyces prunicolor]MDV7218450.1 hypothetical protein [Streptomyces prunicolor]